MTAIESNFAPRRLTREKWSTSHLRLDLLDLQTFKMFIKRSARKLEKNN